jgi:hypothetical protein
VRAGNHGPLAKDLVFPAWITRDRPMLASISGLTMLYVLILEPAGCHAESLTYASIQDGSTHSCNSMTVPFLKSS